MVFGVEVMISDKREEVGSGVVVVDEALVDVCWESAGGGWGGFFFFFFFLTIVEKD